MLFKCSMDVQSSDGCSLLLKYVSSYVTKMKDHELLKGLTLSKKIKIMISSIMSCVTNNTLQLICNFGSCNISANTYYNIFSYRYIFGFIKSISLSSFMTLVNCHNFCEIHSSFLIITFQNFAIISFQILTYMIYLGIGLVPNT